MTNLLIIVGLGFAGIDPVGMILLLGGLAQGFDKKKAFIYALGVFLGTSLLGTILSAIFGKQLNHVLKSLSSSLFNMPDILWVLVYIVIIVFLIILGVRRIRTIEKPVKDKVIKESQKGLWGMIGFMLITALIDPTFIAVLVLSGRQNIVLAFFSNFIWVILSQLPLLLLALAILTNKHQKFMEKFNQFIAKNRQLTRQMVTGLFFLVSLILCSDLATYLITGTWLIE